MNIRPLVPALLLVSACSDATTAPTAVPGAAATEDGDLVVAHDATGGVAGFAFLPPLVASSEAGAAFDPDYLEATLLTVCELAGDTCATPPVAEFTSTSGPDDEFLRTTSDSYRANWRTSRDGIDDERPYRAQVLVDGVVLGYADFRLRPPGPKDKDASTTSFVAGSTVPIKFRIEGGVEGVGFIGAEGGSVLLADGWATFEVPAGAVSDPTLFSIQRLDDPPPDPTLLPIPGRLLQLNGPEGLALAPPATLVMAYGSADVPPGFPPGDLEIAEVEGAVTTSLPSAVDEAAETVSIPIHGFPAPASASPDAAGAGPAAVHGLVKRLRRKLRMLAGDRDGDGVWPPNDQCRDTAPLADVDLAGCSIPHLSPTGPTEVDVSLNGQATLGVDVTDSEGRSVSDWNPQVIWTVTQNASCVSGLSPSGATATVVGAFPSVACEGATGVKAEVSPRSPGPAAAEVQFSVNVRTPPITFEIYQVDDLVQIFVLTPGGEVSVGSTSIGSPLPAIHDFTGAMPPGSSFQFGWRVSNFSENKGWLYGIRPRVNGALLSHATLACGSPGDGCGDPDDVVEGVALEGTCTYDWFAESLACTTVPDLADLPIVPRQL